MDLAPPATTPSPTRRPIPIIFLKTPTTPTDPYTSLFSPSTSTPSLFHLPSSKGPNNGNGPPKLTYEPHHIPILIHTHNLEPLLDILNSPRFPYDALIFTSQRAVSAFKETCCILQNLEQGQNLTNLAIPLYVVGPATADSLLQTQKRYLPRCNVCGEEAGTGEALADIILGRHLRRNDNELAKAVKGETGEKRTERVIIRMGFLTGEKHHDIIPKTLKAAGIQVEEIVVYKTEAKTDFARDLTTRLKTLKSRNTVGHHWVVLFSAFAAAEILSCIGALDEETRKVRRGWYEDERRTYIAAIGPTTAQALGRLYGLVVDAIANKPSPEGVRGAVEKVMDNMDLSGEDIP